MKDTIADFCATKWNGLQVQFSQLSQFYISLHDQIMLFV